VGEKTTQRAAEIKTPLISASDAATRRIVPDPNPNPNPNRARYVQILRVLDAVTGVLSFRFRSKQVSIGVDPLWISRYPKPLISADAQISKFVLINCILLLGPTKIAVRVRAPGEGLRINAPASQHKIMFYTRSYAKKIKTHGVDLNDNVNSLYKLFKLL